MKAVCDCIIPFYNEELRPVKTVEELLKIKTLSRIIVIDDGSFDKRAYLEIKKRFHKVILIRTKINQGKAKAIEEGLKYIHSEYIILIDGDHKSLNTEEIKEVVEKISKTLVIDMIILRKIKDETVKISRYFRHDTIFSGERILRTKDLKNVYQDNFSDYQIENAINTYMIRNHKKVFWMPCSVNSFNKWQKWGWLNGSKRAIDMFKGFISYAGWQNVLWQTLFFCRQQVP